MIDEFGSERHLEDLGRRTSATRDDETTLEERLARFLFDLQADDYEAEQTMREQAWADRGVRAFWMGQAGAILSFLDLHAAA